MCIRALVAALATIGLLSLPILSADAPSMSLAMPLLGIAASRPTASEKGVVPLGGPPETPRLRPVSMLNGETMAAVPPPQTTQQNHLLVASIRALETRPGISARLRHRVELFGRQLVGAGSYLEQRTSDGLRFRLESKIQLGDDVSTLLQVCDGKYVWRYERLHGHGTLTRLDVLSILQALEETGQLGRIQGIQQWPGLGGLSALLRGINASFDVQTVEDTQLVGGIPGEVAGAQQLPVWRLFGQWKREKLPELFPDQKEAIHNGRPVDLAELPPPLPEAVAVYLGRDDLFPYRIEYYRTDPDAKGQGRGALQPIVTLELFEVNLNVPVDAGRFRYNPGNLDCADQTRQFLEKLGLE